LTKKSHPWI
jgi:hypothetical protein